MLVSHTLNMPLPGRRLPQGAVESYTTLPIRPHLDLPSMVDHECKVQLKPYAYIHTLAIRALPVLEEVWALTESVAGQ